MENSKNNVLFKKLDEIENEYINFLADISNIESPTDDKVGVDKAGRYIIEKAKEKGWETEIQKQKVSGDCICITMNPNSKEQPICFSGHLDTVHPIGLFGTPAVKLDGDKMYGPGVLDCKGGIAASFMAMAALHDIGFNKRPVKLLLQSDEENSSRYSDKTTVEFMCKKSKDAIAFINCEPYEQNKIVCQRKGIRKYRFEITGKACHASVCYSGASAITEAAHKIVELEKMKDKDGLTCNCGIISGGTAENTVPENCFFTADIRFKTTEQMNLADKIVNEIANKAFIEGTSCKLTLASWRYPMDICKKNIELIDKINGIFENNNINKHTPALRNGGSDAADVTHYGIPCVDNMGIEGEHIHSKNEFAYIKSIKEAAKRLAVIAMFIK